MKNKEIEELLNRLKDNNDWYVIENKEEHNTEPYKLLLPTERNLLLSYIEQLENKNKENSLLLIEFQDMEQRVEQLEKDNKDLDKKNQILFETNLNLQNNRDKAIEILGNYKHYSTPTEEQNRENEEIVDNAYNILKGDNNGN